MRIRPSLRTAGGAPSHLLRGYVAFLLGAVGVVCLILAGCGPVREPAIEPAPVRSAREILAAHNARADAIEHVWARAHLTLNVPHPDESGKRDQFDLDGHLFLDKPHNLFLHGQVLGQDQFTLGMNAERFWLWVKPQVNTVWTGKRGGAGEERLILSPAILTAALGVYEISPSAGLRRRIDAYGSHAVLSECQQNGGAPVRRIWFDRSARPARIDLFDPTGRQILMAELLKYKRVGQTDVCVAYRMRVYGAAEEVDLVLRLNSVRLDKKPNPRIFEYRLPPGAAEKDLDQPPGIP